MTEANDTDEANEEVHEESPFEKLKLAKEHTDRAERLRAEAKQEILETVEPMIPFNASYQVDLDDEMFEVTVIPEDLAESLNNGIGAHVQLTNTLVFRIGDEDWLHPELRFKNMKELIGNVEMEFDDGAPIDEVLKRSVLMGLDSAKAEHEIEKLKQKGEVYEPSTDHLRTT